VETDLIAVTWGRTKRNFQVLGEPALVVGAAGLVKNLIKLRSLFFDLCLGTLIALLSLGGGFAAI
jgi:hypothetical protein